MRELKRKNNKFLGNGKLLCVYLLAFLLGSTQMVSNLAYAKEQSQGNPERSMEAMSDDMLDPIIEKYIGTTMEGAAVAVVKEDEIVYMKGFGYEDREQNKIVDPKSTVFEYGSVSKLFVWTAVMQLAEKNQLDLNQDIRSYLPESLQKKFQYEDKVTMLDLMNHTAGFDDYIIGLFNPSDDLMDLKKWLEVTYVHQYIRPGQQSVYSNYGAALAGYIVEQISGLTFSEYVRENIYQKAGLVNIYPESVLPDSMLEHKSKAYTAKGSELIEADATYISAYPAGGTNGTVEELAHFAIALLRDQSPLFQKDTTRDELFSTSWLPENGVQGLGISHGFFQYPSSEMVLWHNGETANFSSFFMLIPEENIAVCIVSNTGGDKVIDAEREIAFSFASKWSPSQTGELADANLAAGKYQALRRCHHGITQLLYALSPFDKIVQANEDGTITIAREVYHQVMPYVFYCNESGRSICFSANDQGQVDAAFQLAGYRKIGSFELILYRLKSGLLIFTLLIIAGYGIRKKGGIRRIAIAVVLLVINIGVLVVRALQLNYFHSLTIGIIINIILTVLILVMLVLQAKHDRTKSTLFFDGCIITFLLILCSYGIYTIAG